MILGRGVIASIINDRDGYIYFAKGFSNRTALTQEIINKEVSDVLSYKDANAMFVYFSGLNIYFAPDTPYTKFKAHVEDVVRSNFKNYCILRLGAVTWGDNPNTLVNFLRNKIASSEPIVIQDTYRYLNDKEDLKHWIGMIPPTGKHEMNITGRMIKVQDLVDNIKSGLI